MVHQGQPITIARARDVPLIPYTGPSEFMRKPYSSGIAISHQTDVPIATPDVEEGARRGLSTHEAIDVMVSVNGPGGGEAWHTHMSYYDIIFYVTEGKGTMWWQQDGREHQKDFEQGDLVHMSPGAYHQWLNTGTRNLTIVQFRHFHNYAK